MPDEPVESSGTEHATHERRVDRMLSPAYLEGIDALSIDDVRAMRLECAEVETEVSYVRRLAQARLEIIQAELDRREAGGSLGDLIAALPKILADEGPRSGQAAARIPDPLAPSMSIQWTRGLERLISDATLANLPTLSDADLRSAQEQLRELEHEVSVTRRQLHGVIDAIEHELAQRVTAGA